MPVRPRAVTSLISCNLCSGFAHLTHVETQLVGSKPCNEVRGGAGIEREALPLQVLVPSALPCASGKSASPGRTGGLARYRWRRASLSSTACKPAVRTLAAVANSNAPWGLAGVEGGRAREGCGEWETTQLVRRARWVPAPARCVSRGSQGPALARS